MRFANYLHFLDFIAYLRSLKLFNGLPPSELEFVSVMKIAVINFREDYRKTDHILEIDKVLESDQKNFGEGVVLKRRQNRL